MTTAKLTRLNLSLWRLTLRLVGRALLYALLVTFAVIFCFPFYDMFIGSLMQDSDLFGSKPLIWPRHGIRFQAYVRLWEDYSYGRALSNTFHLAAVRTIGILFFSALVGYAFAKRRFPGRDKLFFLMLGTMMLPSQMTIIPWYLLMTKVLRWTDTYWGFWVPAWASAFGIFWMRQYIATSIPDEMLEAATIDGASVFGVFARVVLPLITPGFAVLGILQFVQSSNLFLGPLLLLSDPNKITAPLALANFQQTTRTAPRYAMMFAGSTLATLPLLTVFFAFQRQLISGIMSGAIKG
ncbi:MAG: carbohydrate ABC transporter permease [Anaerolineae bacterium]|nr:carbohydrate ABC transporter permease [Anaerolineae bacterium]